MSAYVGSSKNLKDLKDLKDATKSCVAGQTVTRSSCSDKQGFWGGELARAATDGANQKFRPPKADSPRDRHCHVLSVVGECLDVASELARETC